MDLSFRFLCHLVEYPNMPTRYWWVPPRWRQDAISIVRCRVQLKCLSSFVLDIINRQYYLRDRKVTHDLTTDRMILTIQQTIATDNAKVWCGVQDLFSGQVTRAGPIELNIRSKYTVCTKSFMHTKSGHEHFVVKNEISMHGNVFPCMKIKILPPPKNNNSWMRIPRMK